MRLALLVLAGVVVLPGCGRCGVDHEALGDGSALPPRPVLLVTHPTVRVLTSVDALLRNQVLDLPRVLVIGVHHVRERGDYRRARAYVQRRGLRYISFKRLTCPISEQEIFDDNACSATFRDLVGQATGIVFTGGRDIPPAFYSQRTQLATRIRDSARHAWEISLLFQLLGGSRNRAHRPLLAERPGLPVLAICLGLQQMNVATGGTLTQEIYGDLYRVGSFEEVLALPPDRQHYNARGRLEPGDGVTSATFHPIRFTGARGLWRAMMESPEGGAVLRPPVHVVSAHHQAVERLGQELEVIATSMDGKVVEALRDRRFAHVLAVQFHPEHRALWMPSTKARSRPGHPVRNQIFSRLAADKTTRTFHIGFWRVFSRWVRHEASASPKQR